MGPGLESNTPGALLKTTAMKLFKDLFTPNDSPLLELLRILALTAAGLLLGVLLIFIVLTLIYGI